MPDENKVSDDDSEENIDTTTDAGSENTTAGEEDNTETSETDAGEEKDKAKAFDESLLEKEDSKKTPPTPEVKREDGFTQKTKQVDTWVNRFDGRINPKTGNPYTFEDLPEDKDWLKQEVADKLHEIEIATPPKVEEKANPEFKALKDKIPELPQSKQEELAEEFKSLQEDGISDETKALTRALKNVNIEIEAEKRGKKAALLGASKGGSSGGINSNDNDSKVSPEFMKKTGINKETIKKIEKFNFINPSNNAS